MRRVAIAIPILSIAMVICCGKPAATPDDVPIAAPTLDASAAILVDAPVAVATLTRPTPTFEHPVEEDEFGACARLLQSITRCFPPGLWPPPMLGGEGGIGTMFDDPNARKSLAPLCALIEKLAAAADGGACP